MKEEELIYKFLEQEFDNIISEFFGIGQYTLRFSNKKKEEFIKEKVKQFIEKNSKKA